MKLQKLAHWRTLVPAFLATMTSVLLVMATPADAAVKIGSSARYIATLNGQSVWQGDLPSKLIFDEGYSSQFEFPIKGILPISTLADRAYGVQVEFEIWSQAGKKLGYETVYSFDWNPVGPETLVSIYASDVTKSEPATLLVRTMWTQRTNGLLSSYLKTEFSQPVEIVKGSSPKAITNLRASNNGKLLTYSFSKPASSSPVTGYEVKIQFIANNSLKPTLTASYLEPISLKKVSKTTFTLDKYAIRAALQKSNVKSPKYFNVVVVAKSDFGDGPVSNGIYYQTNALK